jgi:hypothetical protein
MNSLFVLLAPLTLLFLILLLFKIDRNKTMKSISNNNKDSNQNIEINSNAIAPESPIESVEHPFKKQNSFLNQNDDFGSFKKGVVLDNQTYEYEVSANYCSNFTIVETVIESKEISE